MVSYHYFPVKSQFSLEVPQNLSAKLLVALGSGSEAWAATWCHGWGVAEFYAYTIAIIL